MDICYFDFNASFLVILINKLGLEFLIFDLVVNLFSWF